MIESKKLRYFDSSFDLFDTRTHDTYDKTTEGRTPPTAIGDTATNRTTPMDICDIRSYG